MDRSWGIQEVEATRFHENRQTKVIIYFQMQPTRRNVTQFIYLCEKLYMFQAVPPPIIRISNCIYSIRYFVKTLLLPATVVEETELSSISSTTVAGSSKFWQSTRCCIYSLRSWWWAEAPPETCTAFHINKLCKDASWRLHLKIYLRCTDPWTSKVIMLSALCTGRLCPQEIFPVLISVGGARMDYINEKFQRHHRESKPRLSGL